MVSRSLQIRRSKKIGPSRSSQARVKAEVKAVSRRVERGYKETTIARMRRRKAAADAAKAVKLRSLQLAPAAPKPAKLAKPAKPAKPAAPPSKPKPKPKPARKFALDRHATVLPEPASSFNPDQVKSIRIAVPPGIGDFSWVYSKLVTLGVKIYVQGSTRGARRRLTSLLNILPNAVALPPVSTPFARLRETAIPPTTSKAALLAATGMFPVEINTWLESGRQLKDWLPDIGMDLHYPITISEAAVQAAEARLPDEPYVCLFAASEKTARLWRSWFAKDWIEFMTSFRQRIRDVQFVLIGAKWDTPLAAKITQLAKQYQLPLHNLTGQTELAAALHIIARSEYFVAFPSGLGVLANVLHQPATMFYPGGKTQLSRMPGTWADPETIASHEFHELSFPVPIDFVTWLRDVYEFNNRSVAVEREEE